MPTLGEELRRRREERGTTLAEISEATRIGTRFLKAIEADNFSVLPGGIYTRNFIRSYAASVGMGEDEAIALYHQQMSGQSTEAPLASPAEPQPQPLPPPEQKPRIHRLETVAVRQSAPRTNWSTIVIAAGIVLIILIIAVSLVQRLNRGGTNGEAQTSGNSSAPPASTQPQPAPTPPPQTAPQTQPEPRSAEHPPQTPNLSASDAIRVRLEAAEGPCSMVYWIDDATKATNLFLPQGEARDLPPAQQEVRLSIGNRTVLKVKINERDATFPPETPKFKARVIISRENIKTFF